MYTQHLDLCRGIYRC